MFRVENGNDWVRKNLVGSLVSLGIAACAFLFATACASRPTTDAADARADRAPSSVDSSDICLKAKEQFNTNIALAKCDTLRDSFIGSKIGPVRISKATCIENSLGEGQGLANRDCGEHDVVLRLEYSL